MVSVNYNEKTSELIRKLPRGRKADALDDMEE